MNVRFLAPAQSELDDAVAWYNEQAADLGIEFLDELIGLYGARLFIRFPVWK